jgi:IS1 family transposase/transposase-like protein
VGKIRCVKTQKKPLPLSTLACLTSDCPDFLKTGIDNLVIRKIYGKHQTRYLKCRTCGTEFSELKGTPLWNSKIDPDTFVDVAEHLAEGNSVSATVRLCKVHHDTIERIIVVTGKHAKDLHHRKAVNLKTTALQSDERPGFYATKSQPCWEATTIDPYSKFMVALRLGARDETLIKELMTDTRLRLSDPYDLTFFTDGGHGYASLFPEIYGVAYSAKHTGQRGRPRKVQYRIPRKVAHVQIVKHRQGRKLETVEIRHTYGSKTRVSAELERMGHRVANTSAVERQNGTARQHTPYLQRKGLSFAHKKVTRVGLAELVRLDYTWVKTCRSLKVKLNEPVGRKKYRHQTPTMSIGIASKVFTLGELLTIPLHALPYAGLSQ